MRVAGSTWFLGVVVALLSWPLRVIVPSVSPDPSWQFALHFAAEYGLDFGDQVVFTYGPLGFLKVPLIAYGGPAVLSALYATAVQLSLGLTVVWALRRSFSAPIAFLVGLLAASLMAQLFIPTEAILFVVFIWCIAALVDDEPPAPPATLAVAAGAVSAIEILGKLNTGLAIIALCATAIVALPPPRLRRVALFALSFAVSTAVLWFAIGQPLANVDDYLRTGYEVISGYVRGHTVDAALVDWDWAAALAMVAAGGVGTAIATRGLDPMRRAAVVVIFALFAFALVRQAFVFRVFLFIPMFAGGMLAPWLAFRWRGRQRYAALVAIAVISVLYFPLSQGSLSLDGVRAIVAPAKRADAAVDQLTTLLLPGERDRERSERRALLQGAYALDPASLSLLEGRSVAVHPWEFTLPWAYGLDFEPLPVLGTYTTFTARLDELNAGALTAPDGPQRVLRHRGGVGIAPPALSPSKLGLDTRYAPWEGSRTTLAMLCHFRALRTTEAYQVLGRTVDRCGAARPIASTEARFGEPVTVPHVNGNRIVYARVDGLEPTGLELIRTALYRSAFRYVSFDDGFRYRIYPDINDYLILSAPADVDFPRPFAVAANPSTVTFERDQGLGVGDEGELEIHFYSLDVRPAR